MFVSKTTTHNSRNLNVPQLGPRIERRGNVRRGKEDEREGEREKGGKKRRRRVNGAVRNGTTVAVIGK